MSDALAALSRAGVSIWLDDLSRVRLTSGSLAALVRDRHAVGITTNPTLFAKALSDSHTYHDQISDLAVRGVRVPLTNVSAAAKAIDLGGVLSLSPLASRRPA